MVVKQKVPSYHRSLTISIVGFAVLSIIISLGSLSHLFINEKNALIEKNLTQFSKIIGQISIEYLQTNEFGALEKKLPYLIANSIINYIHIYNVSDSLPASKDANTNITFFTSYNRSTNYPPIPDKISQISLLAAPKITKNYIELITPIYLETELIGYVYLQSSLESENNAAKIFFLQLFLIAAVIIALAVFLATRLKNKLTASITNVVEPIQRISQSKDYSIRCQVSNLREIDALAHNLNVLLTRTQKHIKKQHDEKHKILFNNAALEDKVQTRTDALKDSNQELLSTLEKLHQFQDQLVESEKMASLGDMVAGVAHEVNTPIGLGVTASTLLEDKLKEIQDAFDNKTLKSSQLKKFLSDGTENVSIIYRNLARAANLISSFKKLAVDQSNDDEREIIFHELLQEVLLTLAPKLKSLPFIIEIDCPTNIIVISKPGPIIQILINLIMNSIIHGFEDRDHGKINIQVIQVSSQLNLSYLDDGKGIEHAMKNKIFDPFTTTKRGAGGSGLGLHLVYNLITQALSGNIHLEEKDSQGVHFEINFPVK